MADSTYNLNGGFKPTTKRSADLDGPDFYPTPKWATFALMDNDDSGAPCGNAPAVTAPCQK
jgi:hypothetical protein